MEAVEKHTGKVYPLNRDNVDTDQIIPKQFLKRIERTGFGQFLFYNWRFDDEGNLKQDFDLDNEKYEGASVMVAGENFGCGSSRERSEEHTSELQSRGHLVCRLLLEKKKEDEAAGKS